MSQSLSYQYDFIPAEYSGASQNHDSEIESPNSRRTSSSSSNLSDNSSSLSNISDSSDNVNSLLMKAIVNGNTETAKSLIDNGADVNKENKYGTTPLMIAVNNNNKETAKLFIKSSSSLSNNVNN